MKLSQEIAPFFASRADRWRSEGLFCALSGGADSVALALVMVEAMVLVQVMVPVKVMMAERSNMATLMPSTPTV